MGNHKENLLRKQVQSKTTQADVLFIKEQLGRSPRGIIEISARCKNGHPLVVMTKPVIERREARGENSEEVFPTLYYLVCGSMIGKVSKLESEGLLAKLQEKVDSNQDFKDRFLAAQENYRRERNSLIKNPSQLSESQKESLTGGIGGVIKLDRIKCLHCHLAHYIATGLNVVGEKVAHIVGSSC